MSSFTVELADLRGWSTQVDRAGGNVSYLYSLASSSVVDADFGRILEVITGEYAGLIPEFHRVLSESATGLFAESQALSDTAADYGGTDREVAARFGVGSTADDNDASAFMDAAPVSAQCPSGSGAELPEVSFGFVFDKVCDLIVWVGFSDPREYVTQWIAGDVDKAYQHGATWDYVASVLVDVRTNLATGKSAVAATWSGSTAQSAGAQMDRWTSSFSGIASGCSSMAQNIRDMAD